MDSTPEFSDREPRMVDVTSKPTVYRESQASGRIYLKPETLKRVREKRLPKGDPIAISKVAAIQAVKKTPEIVPLCHPLKITSVEVNHALEEHYVELTVTVKALEQTGVEMEALTGVSAGLLTIWDVTKQFEKDEEGTYPKTRIGDIKVNYKKKRQNESDQRQTTDSSPP